MKKHKLISFLIIFVFLLSIGLVYSVLKDGIEISVKNNTLKEISGLTIKSNALVNDFKIPNISKQNNYKTKLMLSKNFQEGNIVMYYSDKQGNKHEVYLLGYFEKGYSGTINVTINGKDDKGVLSVNVKK